MAQPVILKEHILRLKDLLLTRQAPVRGYNFGVMKTTLLTLLCLVSLIFLFSSGCAPAAPAATPTLAFSPAPAGGNPSGVDPVVLSTTAPTSLPTSTLAFSTPGETALASPISTRTPLASPIPALSPAPILAPDGWMKLPVIPVVSDHVLEIYQRGQELGNNPHTFSKIGDCGSTPAWFLGDFDRGPSYYRLGKYQSLEAVIQQFQGSFDRTSLAARAGFNASALFVPIWADRSSCEPDEGPLTCEYRVNRPVIAFIMLGTNDVYHPAEFEPQMRKIIEFSVEQGVIPILSTKADNKEGDGSINATIAQLALEYQVPLWNFYSAVDPLSNNGLQEDMAHLTWGRNLFDDPEAMTKAWPVRNLTALQALDAVWQKIK
jgi:hypothetical protein